jgi:hypothetical protein
MCKWYPDEAASQTAIQRPSRLHFIPAASTVGSSTLLTTSYVLGASNSRRSCPPLRHNIANRAARTVIWASGAGLYPQPRPSLPGNFGSLIPVLRHHTVALLAKSEKTTTSSSVFPNSTCTFFPIPPDPLFIKAFHFASLKSYTRVLSSSAMRTRFDCAIGVRRDGVECANEGVVGGDQAMREWRTPNDCGRGMLRRTSSEERQRIWSRAPERQAMCAAVGDGTDKDVATSIEHLNLRAQRQNPVGYLTGKLMRYFYALHLGVALGFDVWGCQCE